MRCAVLVLTVLTVSCDAPDIPDAREIPDMLRARLIENPYTYFRFTNRQFAERVCEELTTRASVSPNVNLHGDAHLEQYAVTADSHGLMDFDDSARGPAMVDLARFGVSIVIAAELNGWSSETEALLGTLWSGYREALRSDDYDAPTPRIVEQIRGTFSSDRRPFLEEAERLMRPRSMTPSEVDPTLRFGITLLTEALEERYRAEPPGFFTVKRVGALDSGVGSALTEKYLFRVEGATSDASDDLVLEAKMLMELPSGQCVEREKSNPFPVLVAQSQLANRPFDYFGYLYLDPSRAATSPLGDDYWDGSVFIVHSWIDNYVELSVTDSFASVEELREVIFDSGVQLARGHTGRPSGPAGAFREQLVAMADKRDDDYVAIVETLAEDVFREWGELPSAESEDPTTPQ